MSNRRRVRLLLSALSIMVLLSTTGGAIAQTPGPAPGTVRVPSAGNWLYVEDKDDFDGSTTRALLNRSLDDEKVLIFVSNDAATGEPRIAIHGPHTVARDRSGVLDYRLDGGPLVSVPAYASERTVIPHDQEGFLQVLRSGREIRLRYYLQNARHVTVSFSIEGLDLLLPKIGIDPVRRASFTT